MEREELVKAPLFLIHDVMLCSVMTVLYPVSLRLLVSTGHLVVFAPFRVGFGGNIKWKERKVGK